MLDVLTLGHPFEIGDFVVLDFAVDVVHDRVWSRRRADESKSNEAVQCMMPPMCAYTWVAAKHMSFKRALSSSIPKDTLPANLISVQAHAGAELSLDFVHD